MNTQNIIKVAALALTIAITSGCGIGQKKLLFVSKSNVGVDVDTDQLTAQINIDRQELAIGPTFEGGQQVPLIAGFTNTNRLLGGFGVSSLFAGGDAANNFAVNWNKDALGECGSSNAPAIVLTRQPEFKKSFLRIFWDTVTSGDSTDTTTLPGPGEVKPFIYSTDSSLGLKLAWSATSAASGIPDKVQIGFNREELALAPMMMRKLAENSYQVKSPSFFASLITDARLSTPSQTSLSWAQMFAVGSAATNLACKSAIRENLQKTFNPDIE